MRLSVMAYSFAGALGRGEMTLPEVLAYLASLGVPAVELMDRHVAAAGEDSVIAALERLGLAVSCYDLVTADLVQATASARGEAVAQLKRGLDFAARLGAPTALVVPGRWRPEVERQEAWEALAGDLLALGSHAASLGIALTIEDHSLEAATGCTAADLAALCAAADPYLGVTFDTGNFVFGGQDPLAAWDALAPRVRHVHVKDWEVLTEEQAGERPSRRDRSGIPYRGVALGQGVVPNAAILERMAQAGYTGYLSVEYEGTGDPREGVRTGVDFLRSALAGTSR